MATTTALLTVDEFRARYGDSSHEFWFGEVVPKGMPTTLHGILQSILLVLLRAAGLKTAAEVELRIDPQWQPKPDIIASVQALELPYPTRSVDVVIEVLSPDDPLPTLFKKCRGYVRLGIKNVFVFDPEARNAWLWSAQTDNLERVDSIDLPNGARLPVETIWKELDKEMS